MTTEILIIGIGIVSLLGFLIIIFLRINSFQQNQSSLHQWMQEMNRRIDSTNTAIDDKLTQNLEHVTSRFDKTNRLLQDMQHHIGEFSQFGKSIQDIQSIFMSQKTRGSFGEFVLKDMLQQYFPTSQYSLQYNLTEGLIVDAVIKTSNGVIPIDAKFPLENFRLRDDSDRNKEKDVKKITRDVKRHIDTIKRYIRPSENTTDYALMYIPSEMVYQEIITSDEIMSYARDLYVFPVSPTSFYAYLQAILLSYQGQKIEQRAKEVLQLLKTLQNEYADIDSHLTLTQKHFHNAQQQFMVVQQKLDRFGRKLQLPLDNRESVIEP